MEGQKGTEAELGRDAALRCRKEKELENQKERPEELVPSEKKREGRLRAGINSLSRIQRERRDPSLGVGLGSRGSRFYGLTRVREDIIVKGLG